MAPTLRPARLSGIKVARLRYAVDDPATLRPCWKDTCGLQDSVSFGGELLRTHLKFDLLDTSLATASPGFSFTSATFPVVTSGVRFGKLYPACCLNIASVSGIAYNGRGRRARRQGQLCNQTSQRGSVGIADLSIMIDFQRCGTHGQICTAG